MRYITDLSLSSVDASLSHNGPAIDASQLLQASAIINCSSTASGTIKFQASNDFGNSLAGTVPANWVDIPSASVTLSAVTVAIIPKIDLCYQWIRIVYTSGGTGSVTVRMKAHGV